MSGSPASAPTREGEADQNDDYGDMLDTLDVAIDEAQRKIESGRVYDVNNERTRIKWVRALAYCINVRRQVATDRDLEELAEEIRELKKAQGIDT